jgi:hypothetical protein
MKLLLSLILCISSVGCNSHPDHVTKSANNIQQNVTEQDKELDDTHLQKIEISDNGGMWLTANIRMDHRIFGYAQPDTTSKKMILLSVFTYDVEGNPFKCPYGSYYESSGMNEKGLELRYVSDEGAFIKANIIHSDTIKVSIYIEKRWVEFD